MRLGRWLVIEGVEYGIIIFKKIYICIIMDKIQKIRNDLFTDLIIPCNDCKITKHAPGNELYMAKMSDDDNSLEIIGEKDNQIFIEINNIGNNGKSKKNSIGIDKKQNRITGFFIRKYKDVKTAKDYLGTELDIILKCNCSVTEINKDDYKKYGYYELLNNRYKYTKVYHVKEKGNRSVMGFISYFGHIYVADFWVLAFNNDKLNIFPGIEKVMIDTIRSEPVSKEIESFNCAYLNDSLFYNRVRPSSKFIYNNVTVHEDMRPGEILCHTMEYFVFRLSSFLIDKFLKEQMEDEGENIFNKVIDKYEVTQTQLVSKKYENSVIFVLKPGYKFKSLWKKYGNSYTVPIGMMLNIENNKLILFEQSFNGNVGIVSKLKEVFKNNVIYCDNIKELNDYKDQK